MNNKINNFFLYEKPRNLKNKFNIVEEYIIFFFFFFYIELIIVNFIIIINYY